ncbi:MAG: hypothetical protein LHW45_08165 [Candidatus Cloacimonetes bacterium]|nr:hypothetical protein [Candidatus Cloacimonadota bacterium]MDY0367583.1 hypothetical protein [Candidatus Syntrophosphaera sp.]
MNKVTYAQLREILALTLTTGSIRLKLDQLLSGQSVEINEGQVIDMIVESNIDKDMIRILSGQDPDGMDAIEAMEYISDFFAYMRSSSPKFAGWLKSIRSAASPAAPAKSRTSSKNLK